MRGGDSLKRNVSPGGAIHPPARSLPFSPTPPSKIQANNEKEKDNPPHHHDTAQTVPKHPRSNPNPTHQLQFPAMKSTYRFRTARKTSAHTRDCSPTSAPSSCPRSPRSGSRSSRAGSSARWARARRATCGTLCTGTRSTLLCDQLMRSHATYTRINVGEWKARGLGMIPICKA